MAKRRSIPSSSPIDDQWLSVFIAVGVGVTVGGITTTCWMALNESTVRFTELWLSGALTY
jgi:hypothetical protein